MGVDGLTHFGFEVGALACWRGALSTQLAHQVSSSALRLWLTSGVAGKFPAIESRVASRRDEVDIFVRASAAMPSVRQYHSVAERPRSSRSRAALTAT